MFLICSFACSLNLVGAFVRWTEVTSEGVPNIQDIVEKEYANASATSVKAGLLELVFNLLLGHLLLIHLINAKKLSAATDPIQPLST